MTYDKNMKQEMAYVIKEDNAPARLKGLTITATITWGKLEFRVNMPDDATAQEQGYIKWFIGEIVDKIDNEVPGFIGEVCESGFLRSDLKFAAKETSQ